MAKIGIAAEDIKEYLDIDKEFSDIEEFCNFLLANEKDTNIKIGLKKMIAQKLLVNHKEEKQASLKRLFKENVEWLRKSCCIGESEMNEKAEGPEAGSKESEGPEAGSKKPEGAEAGSEDSEGAKTEEPGMDAGMDYLKGKPESYFDRVKAEFEQSGYKTVIPLEDNELDYSEGIVWREGGVITQQNEIQIEVFRDGLEPDLSKILLVDLRGNRVLALGYLVPAPKGENKFIVVFDDKKCIDYEGFVGISQARFVIYDQNQQPYSRCIELDYEPFAVENFRPLCIDFGTSNTTAGSYGILNRKRDEAEIVRFIDVTVNPNNTEALLLPTIVYVEDCSDEDDIKYLFGYEARKKIEDEHYESNASVYYEIKRWLSSADEEEEIRDSNNKKARILRKDIIKAYMDYVIELAEQYFGTRFSKIHFSAPVKQKEQFINVLKELYKGEKQVFSVYESIDEGVAIVYNQIITLMYAEDISAEENKSKSIMIMDCGGGTTDLASCEYTYRKTDTGVELKLATCFENGNANFGGNNITYRIMQLLKIKIAAMLRDGYIDHDGEVIGLIDKSENEILGLVENHMKHHPYDSDKANSEVYAKFLENYLRAENVIPTRYVNNPLYPGKEALKRIKRNFYYLWRQAEQIKIEFYRTERVLMDFKEGDADTRINIRSNDNYYLYVADEVGAKLRKESKPLEKVSITIKEINRVICGDIYSLLVGLFQNGELTSKKMRVDDFDYYKLSGQSCKISLFSELIKEYIPGRKFRPAIEKSGSTEKRNSEDLKLDCVLGSIHYVRDQIRPEMNVITIPGIPELIYNIYLTGKYHSDKMMFDSQNKDVIQWEISSKNTREYPLKVTGKDEVCEREFIFGLRDPEKNEDFWLTSEIRTKLRKTSVVSEEGIDRFISELSSAVRDQEETVNIVFIVPAKQGYGVYIGQIQANSTEDGSSYRLLQYKYENFEDASKTFFDGER